MNEVAIARGVILFYAGFIGAWTGSLVGCAAYRVPRGISMWKGRSHCENCGHVLGVELMPVLGWLAFRGRCRRCGSRVPVIYPLIEAGLAAVFVAITLRWGISWRTGFTWLAAGCALYVAMCGFYFRSPWPWRMTGVTLLLAVPVLMKL